MNYHIDQITVDIDIITIRSKNRKQHGSVDLYPDMVNLVQSNIEFNIVLTENMINNGYHP